MERKAGDAKAKRIVIVNQERCTPKSTAFSYLRKHAGGCGKDCISVVQGAKPRIVISEQACSACMLRASKCPGGVVTVVRLPTNLDKDTTHRYGVNAFKLHGLPMPQRGRVLGILGANGVGKSTAIQILSGKVKPNLGRPEDPPGWGEIIKYYRGSALQNYFLKLVEDELVTAVKPQRDVYKVAPIPGRTVQSVLSKSDERGVADTLMQELGLAHLANRELEGLSGGELQRLAIGCTAAKKADVYIFDEPSSFLDVGQRVAALNVIRALVTEDTYVIVIEHDLAILDAVSDTVCCLFGEPGAYGIVTPAAGPQRAVNQFLTGYFPAINMRFRPEPLDFAPPSAEKEEEFAAAVGTTLMQWEDQDFLLEDGKSSFSLHVDSGRAHGGQALALLGQNGCGKSTLMNYLSEMHGRRASFKPQFNGALRKFGGRVSQLLEREIGGMLGDRMFGLLVLRPLNIDALMDFGVKRLSGGELQRVAICICLGRPADVFMLDEPSAGLDCELRLVVARVIQRWCMNHCTKAVVIVEHDMLMAASLCSVAIGYSGKPGVECTALTPTDMMQGLNRFMASLDVTVREDPSTGRPRINTWGSRRDREQKKAGTYYMAQATAAIEAGADRGREDGEDEADGGNGRSRVGSGKKGGKKKGGK